MSDQFVRQQDCYRAKLRSALSSIEDALDILDLARAPHDVTALLEQARYRLWEHLEVND